MARNGSGVFNRLYNWVTDAAGGIKILATRMDAEFDGVATALTDSIAKDGQTTATANLPMGGFKHTTVGNSAARNQYAATGQVQDGALTYSADTGSANAYAIGPSPAFTVYVAGMSLRFKAANTNTTVSTVDVNGLGVKTIKKNYNVDLGAGDILANDICTIEYDGTNFQLTATSSSARLGSENKFTKSLWTAEGASVASAADCNIWTTDGNTVHVTGATQIDDWGTAPQAGAWKRVIFDSTPLLNYNVTTNDIPGDADITTAANDSCIVYARSASSYQIFDYTRADGSIPFAIGALTSGTVIETTSGTTADFTGIPSWVKRITISFSGVSTNGTGEFGIRIGDSGGIESTGYAGGNIIGGSGVAFSTSFVLIGTNVAAALWEGSSILTLMDSSTNTWSYSGIIARELGTASAAGGSKSLSGVLDRVQLFTANTFDAGKVNILYE